MSDFSIFISDTDQGSLTVRDQNYRSLWNSENGMYSLKKINLFFPKLFWRSQNSKELRVPETENY